MLSLQYRGLQATVKLAGPSRRRVVVYWNSGLMHRVHLRVSSQLAVVGTSAVIVRAAAGTRVMWRRRCVRRCG